ncbi:MAG: DUF72 domain-containing protein, partial [Planctomycetota bacterium]
KARYQPFNRIVDRDAATRSAAASLMRAAARQSVDGFVIANNKAEGSAPLTAIELAKALAG